MALVSGACSGREDLNPPPCIIGQPCETSPGGPDMYDGAPCVGEPAFGTSPPVCDCVCYVGPSDAAPEANDTADTSSVMPEAGVCGSGPPDQCNDLATEGTAIALACVADSPPAMAGGSIADGTYVLVSGTAYASSCSGVSLPTGGPTTLLVFAGCMQSLDASSGAMTYTWMASGSTLTMDEVCPAASPAVAVQYTATPTTLSELAPLTAGVEVISVFQKQ